MKKVVIYTDGACSCNPGPGGWAGILIYNNIEKLLSGFDKETTNNKMELTAVIKSLEALKEPCYVDLYSDSAYVCNAISEQWLEKWKLNNWKNSQNKQVLNIELWKRLDILVKKHKVNFIKVKGHANNIYNNKCDEYARLEIEKNTI